MSVAAVEEDRRRAILDAAVAVVANLANSLANTGEAVKIVGKAEAAAILAKVPKGNYVVIKGEYLKAHRDTGRVAAVPLSRSMAYHDPILAGDGLLTFAFDILSREETHPQAAVRIELVNALAAYKKGERKHPTMRGIASARFSVSSISLSRSGCSVSWGRTSTRRAATAPRR